MTSPRRAMLALFLGITACAQTGAPVDHAARSAGYERMPIFRLWEVQEDPPSEVDVMMVEAELGVRGYPRFGARHIGQVTAGAVGKQRFDRPANPPANQQSCDSFPSAAHAQRAFLAAGGPQTDPFGLDRDGDGNACGWGEVLRDSVADATTARRVYARDARGYCYYETAGDRIYVSRMFCN